MAQVPLQLADYSGQTIKGYELRELIGQGGFYNLVAPPLENPRIGHDLFDQGIEVALGVVGASSHC